MATVSIRVRLVLTLFALVGIGGLVQFAGYAANSGDTATLRERAASVVRLQSLGDQLEVLISEQHDALNDYLLTGDPGAGDRYRTARLDQARIEGASGPILSGSPEIFRTFGAVVAAMQAWRTGFADSAALLVGEGQLGDARAAANVLHGSNLYDSVMSAATVFDLAVADLASGTMSELERLGSTQWKVFTLSAVASLVAVLGALWMLSRWILRPIGLLLTTARRAKAGENVHFRAIRHDEIGRLSGELERMRAGLYGQTHEAEIVNRFTELIAFFDEDGDLARATLDALRELATPHDGTIHISNQSRDRAVPEGSIGPVSTEVITLGHLSSCPGVRRSARSVTPDLTAPLAIRCPLYPAAGGTLACIPLIALGNVVGAVHLHWDETDALPLELGAAIARITDLAALSIATRRMMTALQGQASTDARTGLANSRTFDEALDGRLTGRACDEPLAVLMLDVDHFKGFNDRNGHPAGDQALQTFANILKTAVRDGDLPARYGGEEFVVMLPGASAADAAVVAERIRAATESTVLELSPGHSDEFTVSIGIAVWPADADERIRLLEAADAALYRAKNTGRNRVVLAAEALHAREGDDRVPGAEAAQADGSGAGGSGAEGRSLPAPIALPRAG